MTHISNYLNFQPTTDIIIPFIGSEDVAITNTGSKVYRVETRKGRIFQLWLSKEEYNKIRNSNIKRGVELYGGNYIYLSPYSDISIFLIAKLLNWKPV